MPPIPLRLGLLHTLSPAPFYIAQERGYFRDEGIDLTFRFFEAAQPIAAAAVSGDIDVGVTALTGGFFNLAEKGTLKVIGGGLHEQRGYQGSAILVSKDAYAAGLTSPAKLAGHSFAITQYGSSFHYMLGRIAEAEHFDASSVTLRPVQQIANMVAAVGSGQVDATIAIASMAKPLAASGQAHIIGWAGDIVPYQITAVFTTARMIEQHADLLHRFARAYQKGVADYREAFLRLDAQGSADRRCHDRRGDPADQQIRIHRRSERAQQDHRRRRLLRRRCCAGCRRRHRAAQMVQGPGPGEGRGRSAIGDRHALPADAMNAGLRLVLRGVCHAYDDLSVLEDIELIAEPGEVMVLVGPSGCGKSTLLGIMGGLLAPTGGEVRCEGEIPDDCLNAFTYVFQDFALLPWRTVAGNVALVLEDRLPRRDRDARVAEVLALTGLAEFADAWPRQLSGGMRQRVGIARALAVRPACLLMDEPLSALDAQTRGLLLDEFAALIERAGTTTIYVTHNLAEAVRLGQQIVVLSRRPGRVRAIQRIDRPLAGRLATDPDLQAIEAELWRLIRDDAAAAERDIENANRHG